MDAWMDDVDQTSPKDRSSRRPCWLRVASLKIMIAVGPMWVLSG